MAFSSSHKILAQYDDGSFGNAELDDQGHMKMSVSSKVSAFGDLNVCQLSPIITGHFNYNINTDIVSTSLVGSGTVTQANAMANVQTGTTVGSSAELVSRRSMRYLNGLGTNMRFTALFSTPASGCTQYIGFANTVDGLMFGYNGTTFGVLHKNNGVDNFIPQTSWNQDKFDGTGKSGATIDPSKGNVFEISMQWLGFGSIYFSIEHNDEGDFHQVHNIRYANTATTPSLHNPNFPFKIIVNNGATTSDVWVKSASYACFIEGPNDINTGLANSIASSITTTTISNVLTIRNRTTYNSQSNHHSVHPQMVVVAVEGTKPAEIQILLNCTIGGAPSWTNISTNNSIVEYDTAGTISGGRKLMTLFLGKSDSQVVDLSTLDWQMFPSESITFYGHSVNDSSMDISIDIQWRERV